MTDLNALIRAHIARIETISVGKILKVYPSEGVADVELNPLFRNEKGVLMKAYTLKKIPLFSGFGGIHSPIQSQEPCLVFHTKYDPSLFNEDHTIREVSSLTTFKKDYSFVLTGFWQKVPEHFKIQDIQKFQVKAPKIEIKNDSASLIPEVVKALEAIQNFILDITSKLNSLGVIIEPSSLAQLTLALQKIRSFQ